MRTSSALTLGAGIVAVIAIGCTTTAPAPAPAPAPTAGRQAAAPPTNPSPQDSTETPTGGGGAGRGGRGGQGGNAAGGAANPLPYARVVTGQAQTKSGLFKVHRIGERVLFEIPRRELNKDLLLVQEIAQTTLGAGYGGQAAGNRVLRFERRPGDNRVALRGISYEVVSSDTVSPIAGAVQAANVPPVIAIFNVEAYGPDSAPVIDVSRLFTTPPAEMSPGQRIGAGYTIDATRSWIERVASFPDNVNIHTSLTFQSGGGRGAAPAPGRGGGGRGAAGVTAPSATVVMSYSFHKLPEVAMTPRLCDNRVGYFSLTITDYSQPAQRVADDQRCFITRYRLEKKDPSAAIS